MPTRFFPLIAVAIAQTSTVIGPPESMPQPTLMPSAMTASQIKAHNQGLAAGHRDFIVCRRTEVIGSLVKKLRVCRTNEQWRLASQAGNQDARDTVDAMNRHGTNNQ